MPCVPNQVAVLDLSGVFFSRTAFLQRASRWCITASLSLSDKFLFLFIGAPSSKSRGDSLTQRTWRHMRWDSQTHNFWRCWAWSFLIRCSSCGKNNPVGLSSIELNKCTNLLVCDICSGCTVERIFLLFFFIIHVVINLPKRTRSWTVGVQTVQIVWKELYNWSGSCMSST